MAQKYSKWVVFLRAFLISLIAAQPAKIGHAQSSEFRAWRFAVEQNREQAYHDYLSSFPAGTYVRDAIVALQRFGGIKGGPATRDIGGANRARGTSSGSSGDLH